MRSDNSRLVIGIVLIALGFLLFADNVIYFPFHIGHFIFSWPMIFVIIGIVIIANSRNNTFGYILLVIGGIGLVGRYTHMSFGTVLHNFWPIILIIIGLTILLNRRNGHSAQNNSTGFANPIADDFLDASAILSSLKQKVTSQNFRGGKLTTILGALDIDLGDVKLAEGSQFLDIFALFGGINIYVPRDMKVVISITSIFGGYEDKRYRDINAEVDESKILVIKGTVLFGGGDIKSV